MLNSKTLNVPKPMAYAMQHYPAKECCFKYCSVCGRTALFHLDRCLNHDLPDTPTKEQYINKYRSRQNASQCK